MPYPYPTFDGITLTGSLAATFNGQTLATVPPGIVAAFSGPLTATGTDQAGALGITAGSNVVTAGAANTGVRLLSALVGYVGTPQKIINATTTDKLVYPASTDTIDGGAASAPVLIPPKGSITCTVIAAGQWVTS